MASSPQLHIASTLANGVPRLPLRALKERVLGESYALHVVFIGDARSRTLNRVFRGKDKPANVLSFPLTKHTGEIYLNPRAAARQAQFFGVPPRDFLAYLLIHGMLHLKGYVHGGRMDKAEARLCKEFAIRHHH